MRQGIKMMTAAGSTKPNAKRRVHILLLNALSLPTTMAMSLETAEAVQPTLMWLQLLVA
jgi:hypothetical protein